MCTKVKFVQYRYSDRGAPLYSGTPAPSSGLVKANFFVYYDFYNRLCSDMRAGDSAECTSPALRDIAQIIRIAPYGRTFSMVTEPFPKADSSDVLK